MRYIFVSDIHGCYDKFLRALKGVQFDKEHDTLVNVGDPFDRGYQSKEVLEFLMSCPNRILIWGNHDLRLQELVLGKDRLASHDFSNGVPATITSFTEKPIDFGGGLDLLLEHFSAFAPQVYRLLMQYFYECVYAAEWKDLIATHAWLPTTCKTVARERQYKLLSDWRDMPAETRKHDWYEATWSNSQVMSGSIDCYPEKTLLIGHWHAWRFAQADGKIITNDGIINCHTYVKHKGTHTLIAIDGCSNYIYGGVVNAYVYEADDAPILYR